VLLIDKKRTKKIGWMKPTEGHEEDFLVGEMEMELGFLSLLKIACYFSSVLYYSRQETAVLTTKEGFPFSSISCRSPYREHTPIGHVTAFEYEV
jgi:hypothetical protein